MTCLLFFFFKQKTAYEMRISDWSSDVCSSDLKVVRRRRRRLALGRLRLPLRRGILARTRRALTAATAFTTATEHLHLVGDDLGEVLLHPVLAGVLVVADLAFHVDLRALAQVLRSEEHTSELQSLMRTSYAVFCLTKNNKKANTNND